MRIAKVLIPFILILAAGCAAASPFALPVEPQNAVLKSKSTPATATITSAMPQMVLLIDDFEADATAWTVCTCPECTDGSATGVALTADHATHGNRALALNFEKNDKPKAVFYIEKPMDLSDGRTVRFDIYHDGTIDGVGFALTTGADAVWHESDAVPDEQGKKVTLTFDITAGTYKTAATNWEFRSFIAGRTNVVRLSIIVYPRKSGPAIIDYICLSDPV